MKQSQGNLLRQVKCILLDNRTQTRSLFTLVATPQASRPKVNKLISVRNAIS